MERPLVAVGGVIIKDNKILLVKRAHPPNKGMWAIPGGKVEYGEMLEDAVKREMLEETNLKVRVLNLLSLIQMIKEGFHYIILDFLCEITGGDLKPASDAADAKFFSIDEIKNLNTSPTTKDMLIRYSNKEQIPIFITEISK
jgi:8-oxo-dGTP diphosphatase